MSHEKKSETTIQYADVGINLTDPIFSGVYHDKQAHPNDLHEILDRAVSAGCKKLMITGSDIEESHKAIELARTYPDLCYTTAGIHPCAVESKSMQPFTPSSATSKLEDLILYPSPSSANKNRSKESNSTSKSSPIAAIGEIGLDYDRLFLSDKPAQLAWFEHQLDWAVSLQPKKQLPLFLHSRAAHADFIRLLQPRLASLPRKGLVHSFTGTIEEMRELVGLGLHIGVNGCSLKTQENLDVVKEIPLDRLQLETDGPWCEIRPSHASYQHLEAVSASVPASADAANGTSVPDGVGAGGKKGKRGTTPNRTEELMAELGLPAVRSVKKEKWASGCMVKGRNEPCTIGLVARVVASVKGVSLEEVAAAAYGNSVRMFGFDD
ncbi:MAG: hypothetical protein M1831_004159 [Alyxoria varia]|nr:MAG: hypothetical protein M1831_004159 [Alyxoria varia]